MTSEIFSLENIIKHAVQYGIHLLFALIVLGVGMWLTSWAVRVFRRAMERRKLEASLISFLSSFANIILKILVVVTALMTVGVQMTSIVAVLGAIALAAGMALSGTLQNFAGGVVLLMFKPFKIGDFIQTSSGKSGTVKKITIFTTVLYSADKQEIHLPNGPLSNSEISNLSHQKARRVEILVNVAYGDKIEVARKVVMALLQKDKRVIKDMQPMLIINDLAGNWVELSIRFWTTFDDFYDAKWDMTEAIYNEFPKHGLHFPFPQLDVHVKK